MRKEAQRPTGRPRGSGLGLAIPRRILLTPEQDRELRKRARAAGQNMSDYVRTRLFAGGV